MEGNCRLEKLSTLCACNQLEPEGSNGLITEIAVNAFHCKITHLTICWGSVFVVMGKRYQGIVMDHATGSTIDTYSNSN